MLAIFFVAVALSVNAAPDQAFAATTAIHWSVTCQTDANILCPAVMTDPNCADTSSTSCRVSIFNCLVIPDNFARTSKACQTAINARNAAAAPVAASPTPTSPPTWAVACANDISVHCKNATAGSSCVDRNSEGCKALLFSCLDTRTSVTAGCSDAIKARNQKAVTQQQACPPQPQPTCPLPAMHVRSARLAVQCLAFTKAGQFPNLSLCKDTQANQNFALVPAADGVKILFSTPDNKLFCVNKEAKLGDCSPESAQSFKLIRTFMQSVQLQLVNSTQCLSTPGPILALQACVSALEGKANILTQRAQSFFVEPTLGA